MDHGGVGTAGVGGSSGGILVAHGVAGPKSQPTTDGGKGGVSVTVVPRLRALRFSVEIASLMTIAGRMVAGEVGFVVTREMPVTPVALPEEMMRFWSSRALAYVVGIAG